MLAWEFHGITTNDIMDLLIVPPEKVIAATKIAVSVEIAQSPSSGLVVIAVVT